MPCQPRPLACEWSVVVFLLTPRDLPRARKVPRAGIVPWSDGHGAACGGPVGGAGFQSIWGKIKNLSLRTWLLLFVSKGKESEEENAGVPSLFWERQQRCTPVRGLTLQ